MRAKTTTSDQPKACIRGKRQVARECQRRRQEADREKRQELARLRHQANRSKVGERKRQTAVASREVLKGKGLFYCGSAVDREKEIQRRLNEANREKR